MYSFALSRGKALISAPRLNEAPVSLWMRVRSLLTFALYLAEQQHLVWKRTVRWHDDVLCGHHGLES